MLARLSSFGGFLSLLLGLVSSSVYAASSESMSGPDAPSFQRQAQVALSTLMGQELAASFWADSCKNIAESDDLAALRSTLLCFEHPERFDTAARQIAFSSLTSSSDFPEARLAVDSFGSGSFELFQDAFMRADPALTLNGFHLSLRYASRLMEFESATAEDQARSARFAQSALDRSVPTLILSIQALRDLETENPSQFHALSAALTRGHDSTPVWASLAENLQHGMAQAWDLTHWSWHQQKESESLAAVKAWRSDIKERERHTWEALLASAPAISSPPLSADQARDRLAFKFGAQWRASELSSLCRARERSLSDSSDLAQRKSFVDCLLQDQLPEDRAASYLSRPIGRKGQPSTSFGQELLAFGGPSVVTSWLDGAHAPLLSSARGLKLLQESFLRLAHLRGSDLEWIESRSAQAWASHLGLLQEAQLLSSDSTVAMGVRSAHRVGEDELKDLRLASNARLYFQERSVRSQQEAQLQAQEDAYLNAGERWAQDILSSYFEVRAQP